jgi:hypothetical protein
MTTIAICCSGMETMTQDGTIQPFTAFGHQTAQAYMKGKETRLYNEIKYCQFCGKEIRLE